MNQSKFVKLVSKDMINKGLQLKVGLNIDPVSFNTTEECCVGGIYYCIDEDVAHWVGTFDYAYICDVTIPSDAIYIDYKTKSKSDRLILGEPKNIQEHRMWKCKKKL